MAVTPQNLNNTNAPVTATSPYGTGKNTSAPSVRDGTNIDASTYNQTNNGFLVALLRAAGIVPNGTVDNADISQVAQAIQSAIAKGNLVEDLTQAGTPNTIVLSSFRDAGNTYNLTHPVAVLQDKQQFRFVAAQTNTSSAVTLQGSQLLVAKNIIGVQAGDIPAGTLYIATYNAATDDFTIRPEIFVPVQDSILDNGDFIIAQRGTTFDAATTFTNTDSNYTLDRWKVIDSRVGSDVVDITQTTLASELPAGARAAWKAVHQRQNEQAGLVQYIAYDKTRTLLNQDVSLSFEIYNSDSVTRNFRAAIVSWQGTVDDMPNDPVATWQTAANLGFATNFTAENTTTTLTANATSWNRFTINGVNIDTANTNNLAVVIWTDEIMANGYEWRVTKVKVEQSSIATAWKVKSEAQEELNCQKSLRTSFANGSLSFPSSIASIGVGSSVYGAATGTIEGVNWGSSMRSAPAITIYHQDGTASAVYRIHDALKITGVFAQHITKKGFLFVSKASSFNQAYGYYFHYLASAEL